MAQTFLFFKLQFTQAKAARVDPHCFLLMTSYDVKLIWWQSHFHSCWVNGSGNRVSGQHIKERLVDTVNMYLCCSTVDCPLRENNRCIPSLCCLRVCHGKRNEWLHFCCSQTLIQTRNATSCFSFCLQRIFYKDNCLCCVSQFFLLQASRSNKMSFSILSFKTPWTHLGPISWIDQAMVNIPEFYFD